VVNNILPLDNINRYKFFIKNRMSDTKNQHIKVNVDTTYSAYSSEPEDARYVFAYSITIKNIGDIEAQLVSRHWVITD